MSRDIGDWHCKMRIGVYTICRDEAQFVDRWERTSRHADHRLVVDTGSADATLSRLTALAVPCQRITVQPFRFDDARNAALALLPADLDVVITLDMDEILTADWRHHVVQAWDGTRLRYGYIWSWTVDGTPDLTFQADRIVGRHTHRWKHPVHEVLVPTVTERVSSCAAVLIEHHPDPTKSRGQYLDLLKLAVAEDPTDDRNAHYLGREYYFNHLYNAAIAEFTRHLALPRATWRPERAGSMRYMAKCYGALGDYEAAYRWFIQSTLEDAGGREPLIDTATFMLAQNAYHATLHFCDRALATASATSYMAERYANNEGPYDLAAVAHHYLGNRRTAIDLAGKALAFNPDDPRLQANLKMMTS